MLTLLMSAALARAEEVISPAEAPQVEAPASIPVASIALEAATLESFLRSVESELVLPAMMEEIVDELPEADANVLDFARRAESHLERGYDRGDLDTLDAG